MQGPAHAQRKIMVVFGTRPEAIKMFPVVHALRAMPKMDVRVCVTAQHRALLDQVLDLAGIVPDIDLDVMVPGQTLEALLALLVTRLGQAMAQEQPSRVLVHGDTLTTLAGALAAHFHKIPVAHVEAGLRSGHPLHPWPEEMCRKAVTAIADLHFAPTPAAVAALRAENVPEDRILMTGNSVIDALLWTRATLVAQPERATSMPDVLARFPNRQIIAVTAHRRENWGAGMERIAAALSQLAARPDVALVCPLHPNPQLRTILEAALMGRPNVALLPPLEYPDFVALLDACRLVLTDSGGIQEEAPALGKPVLVLRETTERPEGIAAGTAQLVGTDPDKILTAVHALLDTPALYAAMAQAHNPYGDGRAANRIAKGVHDAG